MTGIAHRDRHQATFPGLGWPWSEEGRVLAQRLVGLRDDLIRVEETTEAGTHVVRAEMPGIDPARDVEITVAEGVLSVRAERHEEKTEKTDGGYRSEFRYGSFSRSLPLPAGTKDDQVVATYKDGILEIRVPVDDRQAKAATRKVEVQRG
ncbi:Hsp20/alpha crystallin family protein [Candidatus Frankia alpina]|uniref:Hsp20/alpha crystallin family protein n=1 Tax=Candidatus Frankia alpina TaxID=2699483 RepID=A0A4V3YY55_9ACTN|nr:Hsp20/alpha crystallin family protein [Candidatus Frankia alpina]THJ37712.1 Hsp20/alpha crystallin family protein [Candidatus Frankia alpina]